jgi:hypothetical protein
MKILMTAVTTAVLLAASLCAQSREPRNIVISCMPGQRPLLSHVVFAIEMSDYMVSPKVRREILERARENCAAAPAAILTFAPASDRQRAAADPELAEK